MWALEAYGAATALQEMLTIKSDDVYGRAKAYESIIKREPIEGPKLPEGFNVLVKEFQGLGLKVDLLDHGNSTDAGEVIEKTSREIEKQRDDRLIYAQHGMQQDAVETMVDLDDEDDEIKDMLDDEGVEITDAEDLDEPDGLGEMDLDDEDDASLDLGEEL